MRFFGWFRRQAGNRNPYQRWTWLAGRRILTNTPYVLPKDKAEGDRLDLQHHLFRVAIGGNYLAPIRHPRSILDVACGTGIWGREMALQFKDARVLGFDIDRTPLERSLEVLGPGGQFPKNFRFQQWDALKPFPLEDGEFEFTHGRAISPFIPIKQWPQVAAEMVRVTSEGGYVEIVEADQFPVSPSPAYTALIEAFVQMIVSRGLYAGAGKQVPDYLRQAGLKQVRERPMTLGTGRDAQRQQRLLAVDVLAALKNVGPVLIKLGYFTEERYQGLLLQAEQEVPQMGITFPVRFIFGQK